MGCILDPVGLRRELDNLDACLADLVAAAGTCRAIDGARFILRHELATIVEMVLAGRVTICPAGIHSTGTEYVSDLLWAVAARLRFHIEPWVWSRARHTVPGHAPARSSLFDLAYGHLAAALSACGLEPEARWIRGNLARVQYVEGRAYRKRLYRYLRWYPVEAM
jgi:hypothetical protein